MATSHADGECSPNVAFGSFDAPMHRAQGLSEPSAELLDRALTGWERFLDTFEAASDE